ncbi:nuclear transport factor 2 family protein [Kitasatospora sp. NPDC059648]|uniref:nuclear transport factor 2 family protein n=1 Tax=Kitasatospora sp. NPDC059648 TaxID=3346894 RepID=UPI0036B90DAF
MMTRETSTTETLERFYAAEAAYVEAGGPGAASFDEVAACLAPDVTLHQAPGLPYSGVWQGPEGIERFLAVMGEAWRTMEFLDQRCFVDGQDVVVTNHVRFVARATGRELHTRIVQEMTVRDGRIAEIRPFYWDPAAVTAALTLPA